MEVEKGKTVKYLREKLGGASEHSKENLKKFNAIKKQMLEALGDEELTIQQLTQKTGMPTYDVVYYITSLVKFGLVAVGSIDDMDEYYTYKKNN